MTESSRPTVIGGVDDTAAALDSVGKVLGTAQFPATSSGYLALLDWLRSFGEVTCVGIEEPGRMLPASQVTFATKRSASRR